ncbi:MAG: L,D-transpeptidase family protein [Lachnospiraceae bacterium]|nr:L,D-transpeptidase family protein [Lachnospiraceae bacterium]
MNKGFKKGIIFFLLFAVIMQMPAVSGLFAGSVALAAESTPAYYIKVNKQCNTVTVYGKNKKGKYTVPVKAFVCSAGEYTPLGTFKTSNKYTWRALVENTWGQYATRITGSILFHSVPYTKMSPDSLMKGEYDKLGEHASHGCVRLSVMDAKWIYENCVSGTKVTIYESEDPGPLGKPEGRKIGDEATWDPTDIWSEGNPFDQALPRIVGKSVVTVGSAKEYYEDENIKAYSSIGFEKADGLSVEGEVKDNPGVYRLVYTVTDEFGRQNSKVRIVKVTGTQEK